MADTPNQAVTITTGKDLRNTVSQINNNFDYYQAKKQRKIIVSDKEPAAPQNGDMWIDISKGN